ncbi:hypothetical protein EC951288_2850B, partial [Escherichia coli 95.1288]
VRQVSCGLSLTIISYFPRHCLLT